MSNFISRRNAIAKIAGGVALSASISPLLAVESGSGKITLNEQAEVGHRVAVEVLCQAALTLGLTSVDLQEPGDWHTLKKHGLTCNLAAGADLGKQRGFIQKNHHERLMANYEQVIPQVAEAGLKNLICYSGSRDGLEVETALSNSAAGLKRILKLAEKNKVTLFMELTNNDINSSDYDLEYSVQYSQLGQRLGSERFKILQEVCQLQAVSHSAVTTLQKYHPYLGYYYLEGMPKQNEFAKATAFTAMEEVFQYNRSVKQVV